jgi:type IV pilus assembly protein PilW
VRPVSARRMSGVSLIELMIALVLGTILTIGLLQVFSASRTSYALSEGLSRVQENARFAIDYMQRDMRMVGHFGCANDQARLQRPDQLMSHFAAGGQLDFSQSIQGFDASTTGPGGSVNLQAPTAGWTPALPAYVSGLTPAPLAGSDVLLVRFLSPEGIPVVDTGTSSSPNRVIVDPARWSVLTAGGVANPTLFGVADCSFANVFQGSTVSPATGTITATQTGLNQTAPDFYNRFTASPSGQTMLYRADALVYYIGVPAGRGPSLYRARLTGGAAVVEELVEGIENLQILYGRDQSADVTRLTGNIALIDPADSLGTTANEWRRVGQVQIGVVARSPDPAAAGTSINNERLRILGTNMTPPADARYRSTYETTVALRNRLYGTN